ncbi:MAG: hypothetical protein ACRD2N_22330 [Vicinamibacterales bacterium]
MRWISLLRTSVVSGVVAGAVGSVPAGLGVVEGYELPYLPEALETKQENQANWLTPDPEIKCFLPGVPRATYMPFRFRSSKAGRRSSSRTNMEARCGMCC